MVDTLASDASVRKDVGVQVPLAHYLVERSHSIGVRRRSFILRGVLRLMTQLPQGPCNGPKATDWKG